MVKKACLLFFLLFFNILYPLGLATPVNSQTPSQISELTYVSNSIIITSSNISKILQNNIFVGYIFGGNTIYHIRAGFYINGDFALRLTYIRDNVQISLLLSKNNPDFNGTITYYDCCSNVLKPLTLSIAISNTTKALIDPNFQLLLSYTVLTNNYYRELVSKYKISSVNALGYPYPPRAFIVGLMITLVGVIPIFIVDKVLLKLLRK